MVKRKSLPGAGSGQKAKVQRKFSVEQLQEFPHVKKLTDCFFGIYTLVASTVDCFKLCCRHFIVSFLPVRLSEVVIPCGGGAAWLEQKYPTQDCTLKLDFCFSLMLALLP